MFVIQSILLVHFDEKCRQNIKAGLWRILFSTFWYNWSLLKINVVITWITVSYSETLFWNCYCMSFLFSSSLCRSRGFLDNFAVSIDFGLFLNIRYVCQKLIVYICFTFYFGGILSSNTCLLFLFELTWVSICI